MKYSNLRAFEKHIENAAPNHFSTLYLILVKEDFSCKVIADRLVAAIAATIGNAELCTKIYEGHQFTDSCINVELNAMTLFSNKQIIRVNQADVIPKTTQKLLEEYFLNPNPAMHLVLSAPTLNRATNFYKKAEKSGIILELEEEKGAAKEKSAIENVHAIASRLGKKIDAKAAQLLVKQLGTDHAMLFHEIEKLACFVGDRTEMTTQDVSAICTSVNNETIWQLGEAIFNRNATAALRISKGLLNDGSGVIGLLRQLRSQFQTDFQVCSILASGQSPEQVTQQFPYMKGFILERHIKIAQSYGIDRFKRGILKIDEIELMAKNGISDELFLAEMLIIHLTS